MNKRMKKKHELENRLRIAEYAINLLIDQNKRLQDIVEKLEQVNSQNVQATNARFDQLEAANKSMRVDLSKFVIEFGKNKKRGFFSRK